MKEMIKMNIETENEKSDVAVNNQALTGGCESLRAHHIQLDNEIFGRFDEVRVYINLFNDLNPDLKLDEDPLIPFGLEGRY